MVLAALITSTIRHIQQALFSGPAPEIFSDISSPAPRHSSKSML